MWKKLLIIIFLFYFFALLQNSFLVHFSLLGTFPNLVFILFFILIFFHRGDKGYQIILLALASGFLLDVFSYTYIGPSIIGLIIIGFLLKKTQLLLKNKGDSHPLVYFSPLFLVYFVIYEILTMVYLRFLDPSYALMSFDLKLAAGIIYNLFFATIGFWIYKKILANVKKI